MTDDDGQDFDRNQNDDETRTIVPVSGDDEEPLVLGPPPPAPVRKVRADALQRADTAWRTRVAGGTWREAAELAGFSSPEHAISAVKNVFGQTPVIDRDALRVLWRDRLERAWRQVCADMAERVPGATTAAVRIATCAMQLDGLAEPNKVDVTVNESFDLLLRGLSDAGYLGS